MSLFSLGNFTLNSGKISQWKLECDALTDGDWDTLAFMVSRIIDVPFSFALGVPSGGSKLAMALHKYRTQGSLSLLLVDDVLTSGTSMERLKALFNDGIKIVGAVVFARGKCPDWIKPVFQLPEQLWLGK